MEWTAEETKRGTPSVILREGETMVAKIYLSPDSNVLRIVLPEWTSFRSVSLNYAEKIIDFKRKGNYIANSHKQTKEIEDE